MKQNRRTAHPWSKVTTDNKDAPLYAPAVEPLRLDAILTAMRPTIGKQHLIEVKQFLTNPEAHPTDDTTKVPVSKIDAADIKTMETADLIRAHATETKATVHAFTVKEIRKGKVRRRTIFHTLTANNNKAKQLDSSLMKVTSIRLLASRLRSCKYASTRDFKSYFHQLAFNKLVSMKYIFKTPDGKSYRLLRCPMGHRSSPRAATVTTNALIEILKQRVPQTFKFVYDVIIDDVLLASSNRDELEVIVNTFDSICKEFNVTISSSTEPSPVTVYRGIEFDLNKKTQRLKVDYVNKFGERTKMFKKKPTKARLVSLVGMIAYAVQIIDVPNISAVYKTLIRGFMHKPSGTEVEEAAHVIIRNAPQPMPPTAGTPYGGIVCADATPAQIAAIYADMNGSITARSRQIQQSPIHIAEAMATLMGQEMVPPFKIEHEVFFYTDNTPWLFAIHNSARSTTMSRGEEIQKSTSEILSDLRNARTPEDLKGGRSQNLTRSAIATNIPRSLKPKSSGRTIPA